MIELPPIEHVKIDSLLIKSVASAVKESAVCVPVALNPASVSLVWAALREAKHPRVQVPAPVSAVQMLSLIHILVRQSSADILYLFMMNCATQVSMSPARVPIGTPARGERPMDVSWHLPSLTADREEPLPRWQTMTRGAFSTPPISSMHRLETKRWDVPWKP